MMTEEGKKVNQRATLRASNQESEKEVRQKARSLEREGRGRTEGGWLLISNLKGLNNESI